ncbi:MFS transporter [Roseomonas sp. GC11]|uniref:MFS transporter n=1 Tax=Roseomonas sp. GC11 TaxID=2950546 RepID=UPI00210C000B|nr:MFS transporter [Roseomonas sp. GC11]MCQ4160531.1 MFS transporter [Roseomonas sp. GC11]
MRPPAKAASAGGVLLAIGGLYLGQSVIGGLAFQALPAILRQQGQGLELISLLSLMMLPQALKFLWAPMVERLRLAPDGRRRSRAIILAGQGMAVFLLLVMAVADFTPGRVFILLAAAMLVAATLDIACDAFAIEQLPPSARGWGNTVQIGGAYLGMMLGGGLSLVVTAFAGWRMAVALLALVLGLAALPLALIAEAPRGRGVSPPRPALRHALARPALRQGLGRVVLMQAGLRLALPLAPALLVDAGLSLAAQGWLNGVGSTAVGLAGALAAGALASHFGPARVMRGALAVQGLIFALIAAATLGGAPSPAVMAALALALGLFGAMGFVALYAAMMHWADGHQPGVDFTLLQCADALLAALAGLCAGLLAQALGYAPVFMLAAFCAFLAVPWLTPRMPRMESLP